MSDDEWKSNIFLSIIDVYNNFNFQELNDILEFENTKNRRQREKIIKEYFEKQFKINQEFLLKKFLINFESKTETYLGFYDIKFEHSYWCNDDLTHKYFSFECKCLEDSPYYYSEYVFNNKPKKTDGGIYRFFIKKYSSNMNFGGMIGFVMKDDWKIIKTKLIDKINKERFDLTHAESNIKNKILDNSIFTYPNTFDCILLRDEILNEDFNLHNIILDFTHH